MEQQKLVLIIFCVLVVVGAVSITVLTLNLPQRELTDISSVDADADEAEILIRPNLIRREPIDPLTVTEVRTDDQLVHADADDESEPETEDSTVIVVETRERADAVVRDQVLGTDTRHTAPDQTVSQTSTSKPSPAAVTAPKPADAAASTVAESRKLEYWIQAGSFTELFRAEQANEDLRSRGLPGRIIAREIEGTNYFRVRVGPYATKNEAEKFLEWINAVPSFSGSYISQVTVTRNLQ